MLRRFHIYRAHSVVEGSCCHGVLQEAASQQEGNAECDQQEYPDALHKCSADSYGSDGDDVFELVFRRGAGDVFLHVHVIGGGPFE